MTKQKTSSHTRRGKVVKRDAAKPAPLGMAKTMKAAMAITKLPLHLVQGAKDDGCNAFRSNGTVDCDALVEFVSNQPKRDDDVPNYFLERALDIRANRKLKEQKHAERAKLSWSVDKIRRAWSRNIIATKTKLTVAESSIAAEVGMRLGLKSNLISLVKEIALKHIRAAEREMHAGEWGKTECPHCKKEIKEMNNGAEAQKP